MDRRQISMDRVKGLPSEHFILLRCNICGSLAQDLVSCENCFEPYCKDCIESYANEHNGFCKCSLMYVPKPPDEKTKHWLGKIKVACCFAEKGCNELLPYSEVLSHETTKCGYRSVVCKCGKTICAKDIEVHKLECSEQLVRCEQCHKEMKRTALATHVIACSDKPVPCPYCQSLMSLKSLADYEANCPGKMLECVICGKNGNIREVNTHQCIFHVVERIKAIERKFAELSAIIESRILTERLPIDLEENKCYNNPKEEEKKNKRKEPTPSIRLNSTPSSIKPKTKKKKTESPEKSCIVYIPLTKTAEPSNKNCPTSIPGNEIIYSISDTGLLLYDIKDTKKLISSNVEGLRYKRDYGAASALVEDRIYISGGRECGKSVLKSTEAVKFDRHLTVVEAFSLADMIFPKTYHALTPLDCNRIISVGGEYDNKPINKCEVYFIKENKWTIMVSLNCPRSFPSVCTIGQKYVYVFGSKKPCECLIESLSLSEPMESWAWTKIDIKVTNFTHEFLAAAPINENKVLLLGKKGGIHFYNLTTNTLEIGKKLTVPTHFKKTPMVRYKGEICFLTYNPMRLMMCDQEGNCRSGPELKLQLAERVLSKFLTNLRLILTIHQLNAQFWIAIHYYCVSPCLLHFQVSPLSFGKERRIVGRLKQGLQCYIIMSNTHSMYIGV
eukprot:TRINITY_DN120168_c0_g1_i1.p1 TRINITY_DN120168_c0_g1~~TRINITY_DN120168_c0_g1_i1.p1  ORF type:complete len:671 (-),score=20.76 TRINITY_DN120168_c0_g1_i1:433-2445(-)